MPLPVRNEGDELAYGEAPERTGPGGLAWVKPGKGLLRDPERGWWTSGHGSLKVTHSGGLPWMLLLRVARAHRSWAGGADRVDVLLDGRLLRRVRLPPSEPGPSACGCPEHARTRSTGSRSPAIRGSSP